MNLIIIIIGIISAIVIFINPFIGLLATIALIPQALIPAFTYMLFGIFTMATPIKLIGGMTFASSLIRHQIERKSWDFLKRPQMRFFILFLIWIFISGFTQPGALTRENFTAFTSFAMIGFIILSLITDIKRFRWVLWAGLISVFIVSLQAVFSYSSFAEAVRIRGASYGPNYFALGLLPFLGITFYNTFAEKKMVLKAFSLVITAIIAIALIVTFSRAGLVGLLGMLLIATIKAEKKFKAVFLLALCVVLLINVLPSSVWERFTHTRIEQKYIGDPTVDSTTRRYLLAKAAWEMFLDHPLFGAGVGNYYWECGRYEVVHAGRAHTTYLEIMAEMGIIGIFLFLGILFYTFKSLNKIMKSDSYLSSYAYGLYMGLVGFLIAALFLHAQHEKVLWFVIFMAMALENIYVSELARSRACPVVPKGLYGVKRVKKRKKIKSAEEIEVVS
ncbi:MAG: O-antigen ligase family protein [Deltaproteobacteria bacterium]|nr:O-antigen ligase family protein [Deltaproteobacteria bacterium]